MHVGCALDSVCTINTFYTKRTSVHCSTIDHALSVVSIIMYVYIRKCVAVNLEIPGNQAAS